MFEFVKTATGWRVFWDIDPLATVATARAVASWTVTSANPLQKALAEPLTKDKEAIGAAKTMA